MPSANGAASGSRRSRAAIQPPCFWANSLASRTLPRGGMVRMTSRLAAWMRKRIAAGLAVAADAHRIDRLVEDDLDRLRFSSDGDRAARAGTFLWPESAPEFSRSAAFWRDPECF